MFLKGDFYYKKYSADNFEKAMEYFEKAVELDSNYTDAWWYLGLLYFETHGWLYFQKENVEKSIYCAEKAISLDETNANAHFFIRSH
jgi:tetratricopeptide (TPR) repeat protein